jgi:hypothetical protein
MRYEADYSGVQTGRRSSATCRYLEEGIHSAKTFIGKPPEMHARSILIPELNFLSHSRSLGTQKILNQ